MNQFKSPGKLISSLFFAAFFCLGLAIYQDYGISFDEPAQRLIGVTNLNHIAHRLQIHSIIQNEELAKFPKNLNQITDKDYGVVFEVPAAFMEHFFGIKAEREIYLGRHLLTFLFFFAGVLAVYRMAERRFGDWRIGLLAATLLILSPRIFADAFYNSKDLVFLSVFAIAMNTCIAFLLNPNWRTATIHGLTCALAIDTRLMAVIIPAMTIAILLVSTIKAKISPTKLLANGLIYLVTFIAFSVLLWPYLWDSPLENLIKGFQSMAKFRHNPFIVFMGASVRASNLPWFYLPLWICITTPILYLALFSIGTLSTIYSLIRNNIHIWKTREQLQDLIFLFIFFGPIIAVTYLHSILYNGWRHLFFVYPAFILVAVIGFKHLWDQINQKFLRALLLLATLVSSIHTAQWMIVNHPLQNLYFNRLAKNWNTNFEVDYWGVANKQALEKILADSEDDTLKAWPGHGYQWPGGWQLPFIHNLKLLSKEDRARINVPETKNESDYVITSMKGNDGFDTQSYQFDYRYKKISEIMVDDQPVLTIFKKIADPQLPILKTGDILKFYKKQMGINYLASGWQDPEDWGTWSASTEPRLRIPVPSTLTTRPKYLKISMRALIGGPLRQQNIEIFINNNFVKKATLTKPFDNQVDIPLPENDENLELKFKLPNAAKPIDLGINQDVRQIAIGLESIEFK